eukprot:6477618-Amphidinium_carterae.2
MGWKNAVGLVQYIHKRLLRVNSIPGHKLGRLIGLTRHVIEEAVTKKTLQVVLGHRVHAQMRWCAGRR